MAATILLLDDDRHFSDALAVEFKDHGYNVFQAHKISDIDATTKFDFAVLDLRLVGEFGLDAIEKIKKQSADCKIVILSGYGSIQTAMEAAKKGAVDYLTKPASFQQIENALLQRKSVNSSDELRMPSLSQVEHEYIDFILKQNDGNISKAARALGLHRQSLQRKLKKYT